VVHPVATVRIAGSPISQVDLDGTVALLLDAAMAGTRLAVHFCTTHTVVLAREDARLQDALEAAGLNVADGVPLVWVGRLRGARLGRVCGLDLMPALVDAGRRHGMRHYLYGGAPGAPERLASRLHERYPGAQIVGIESPPFRPLNEVERAETIDRLNAARPHFVWVGLGTPKQDLWLADHRDELDAAALLAVGAAFEIVSGARRRAPPWMQRAGLEWLFRLMLEPRRLWRRYAVANVRFVWVVAREDLGRLARRRVRFLR
jgi:N-acetylglucosaminyldiphosphoundecaprenol N-acetyl-beta-D-mannosaminyltransferase